jgi:MFS family permease
VFLVPLITEFQWSARPDRGRPVSTIVQGVCSPWPVAVDRVGIGGPSPATLSFACTAGGALALIALETRPRGGWLLVFALLLGLGFGARGAIITSMASDWFGGRHFGAIYGPLNFGNGIGAALGPCLAASCTT